MGWEGALWRTEGALWRAGGDGRYAVVGVAGTLPRYTEFEMHSDS